MCNKCWQNIDTEATPGGLRFVLDNKAQMGVCKMVGLSERLLLSARASLLLSELGYFFCHLCKSFLYTVPITMLLFLREACKIVFMQ